MSIYQEILNGERSNAVCQFFCGDYFVTQVTSHAAFSRLQSLVWDAETKHYDQRSKKTKARMSLRLTSFASDFFSTGILTINKPEIQAVQAEILKDWCDRDCYFGYSINWHKVFAEAYDKGFISKTEQDFDSLKSLMDIPRY